MGIWTGRCQSLTSRVQDAAQLGDGSVNMVYMPMSHKGVDFSTMMSDTLFEGIRGGKITKKAKKNLTPLSGASVLSG